MQELLADVRRGLIDVVVTYKIDRITRSLRDFYVFWETLEQHEVTYVSATQSFDTSTPAGNLMLNILLSFGQYERELTHERTTTKMRARAEKGLWNGGWCPIGLRVVDQRLEPNPDEAPVISAIFDAVIRYGNISEARDEINERGHRTKRRVLNTKDRGQREIGGRPFSYDAIRNIIQNPNYKGATRYQGEVFEDRHEAIIPSDIWRTANDVIAETTAASSDGLRDSDKHVHLFKGVLRCGSCGSMMTPYPSGKRSKTGKPYLYYSCTRVIKDGKHWGVNLDCRCIGFQQAALSGCQ